MALILDGLEKWQCACTTVPRRDPTHSAIRQQTTKLMMALILDGLEKWQSAFTTPRMLDVWSLVTPRLARRVAFFAGSLFVLLPALASGQSHGCHCDLGRQPAFPSSLGLRGVHRHELALVQYPPGDGQRQPDFLCVRAPGRRTGVRRGQGEQPQGPRLLFDGTQVLDSLVHCADESQHRGQRRDHADQPECQ